MSKNPKTKPSDSILQKIGNLDEFKEKFTQSATSLFGSGWVWLVFNKETKNFDIVSTANQDCPLSQGNIPLLTIDLWEHAYYLKYQNRRADYITAWWNIVDWSKVEEKYLAISGRD